MSVGAVNKSTGDRIPTAGMPAIDDALDLTSVNPVQNDIITAAFANKQDKTDNNLQTTDKTVVGGINELKSGLTNYQAQNDLNLEVPDRKNLYNINDLTDSSAYVTHSVSGDTLTISCTGGTYSSCNYGNRNNLIFNPGRYYVKVKTVSTVTGYAIIGFRNANNQFVALNESISEVGNHSFVVDLQELAFFSVMVTGSEAANNTVVIEDIMVSPYDEAYTPYIPSVDARLEAVESGLTNYETSSIFNELYAKKFGKISLISGTFEGDGNNTIDLGICAGYYGVVNIRNTTNSTMSMHYFGNGTLNSWDGTQNRPYTNGTTYAISGVLFG